MVLLLVAVRVRVAIWQVLCANDGLARYGCIECSGRQRHETTKQVEAIRRMKRGKEKGKKVEKKKRERRKKIEMG